MTKWSKLDTMWRGVSIDTLLEGIETAAVYVVQFSDGGYDQPADRGHHGWPGVGCVQL